MSMEKIIKKAIEGGYIDYSLLIENEPDYFLSRKDVTDPLFWQALGKACGWDEDILVSGHKSEECSNGISCCSELDYQKTWKRNAIRFHEINLTESWDKAVEYLSNLVEGE